MEEPFLTWEPTMWFLRLHDVLNHLSRVSPRLPELAIMAGAVLLVGSAASCVCSPSEEKDELFQHRSL
jgi:hypothetical protein